MECLPDEARAHLCLDVSGYVSSLLSFWDESRGTRGRVGEDRPRKESKIAGRRS